jgi:hypothetical protein
MSFEEQSVMRDIIKNTNDKKHNFIIVRDPTTGAILQTRKNLVVRQGREFSLRKMFNIAYPSENTTQLGTRYINLFGIGTGGTPVSDPFTPIVPTPSDIELNSVTPFRVSATALSSGDAAKYFDGRVTGSTTAYYKKTFTSTAIVLDNTNDDYYCKLTLNIDATDARGTIISELGLYTSVNTANVFTAPKIATRVTFQSEPLSIETSKGLEIEYYVYA